MIAVLVAGASLMTSCSGTLPYYRESHTGLKRYYEDDAKEKKDYYVRTGNGTFYRYRYHY